MGDFISQMMSEPKQVDDDMKNRQQLTYEHQMSRLSAYTKYPFGMESSFIGRNYHDRSLEEGSSMEVPSQYNGPEIAVSDEVEAAARGSRLKTSYEASQSPRGAWRSTRPTMRMSSQRERTGASFLPGGTASHFQSKLSQYGTSKITSFDVARRNNIGIRFASTQKERIRLAQAAGSRLDSSPTRLHEGTTQEKLMNLRPRETEKELGPPSFRYRPNNYLEKVTDAVRNRNPGPSSCANEVFAPNLLNKKGELAKNLKPLPAGYQHDGRRKRDQSSKEAKAKTGTEDGPESQAQPATTPAGESEALSS